MTSDFNVIEKFSKNPFKSNRGKSFLSWKMVILHLFNITEIAIQPDCILQDLTGIQAMMPPLTSNNMSNVNQLHLRWKKR